MAQIGTIKLQTQNSGVVDVPVFDTGDSGSGIYEFVRVETESGTGFIPVTDPADATYPFLRVQSQNQGVVAVTDTASAIPDSGVARWTFDDADTESGTALDSWGSNDGTLNGGVTTGVTGANQTYNTAEAYSFDGVDDYVSQPAQVADGSALSVSIWAKFDSLPSSGERSFFSARTTTGNTPLFYSGLDTQNSTGIRFGTYDGSTDHFVDIDVSNVTAGTWYHFVGTYSPTNGYSHYLDATQEASITDTTFEAVDVAPVLGAYDEQGSITAYFEGDLDDPRVYDKELSSTEVSNLYNTGSISG